MISAEKLKKLQSANNMLDEKYGEKGTVSRAEFETEAVEWGFCALLLLRHVVLLAMSH